MARRSRRCSLAHQALRAVFVGGSVGVGVGVGVVSVSVWDGSTEPQSTSMAVPWRKEVEEDVVVGMCWRPGVAPGGRHCTS